MLNLLDRCNKPRSMLEQAKYALAPGGVLLVALVLPYKPYVEGTISKFYEMNDEMIYGLG